MDDIIVLSNGQNVKPDVIETAVSAPPMVKSALLCGTERAITTLTMEPRIFSDGESAASKILNEIWPLAKTANQDMNVFGQVRKEMVMFADEERPSLRAGKGSVQRSATSRTYICTLDALYGCKDRSGVMVGR